MTAPAQITLAFSSGTGIIAFVSGEQYRWAQVALETSGFQWRLDGTYALPLSAPDATRATVTNLVRAADRHQSVVTTSSRRYLGDVADAIAEQLPGQWDARVNVYSRPVWQQDLVPWLWDAGELSQAMQTNRIVYAAVLSDGAGIDLLLVERPGHDHGYVVGALAPDPFDDNYEEPNAPSSVVVPAAPGLAARAISDRFLPAYHQALHARRIATVASGLDRLREEHQRWQAILESGRFSDGMPLGIGRLAEVTGTFQDRAWHEFQDFLTHAPALLERCRPADTAWPKDAAALDRLRSALEQGRAALTGWDSGLEGLRQLPLSLPAETCANVKTRRDAQLWPAVETWLADGDALIRQARAAVPSPRTTALPARNPGPATPPPTLPASPGTTPTRR